MAKKKKKLHPAIFASINHQFSAFNILETKKAFQEFYNSNDGSTDFVEFVAQAKLLPEASLDVWREGVQHFPPGTFDLVSLVVAMNFGVVPTNHYDGLVTQRNGESLLPMMFQRSFEDRGIVSVRHTIHGIKVTLTTTAEGYQKGPEADAAEKWPNILDKY